MNNKGFTLIEMLVVVAIILALSVSAGLSADFSLKKAKKNEYRDLMWDVFKSADVYSELSDFSNKCSDSDLNSASGCSISIEDLIKKGLLDENIKKKNIPIYATKTKFTNSTQLVVKKSSGNKTITFDCGKASCKDACLITMNDINSYNQWGNCS